MSFTAEQIEEHCRIIQRSPRVKNKIVILCEGGDREILTEKRSPSFYRKLEQLPDANFYKACIPTWWQEKRPEFFPCGDRNDVLNCYFQLKQWHQTAQSDSYLNADKLFAFIDLDLQPSQSLANYLTPDTETLFEQLYQANQLNIEAINQHSIFITGLIYKEAYFLVPELQSVFDNFASGVSYHNQPLNMTTLYENMAQLMTSDENLKKHFTIAIKRINYLADLQFDNITALQDSWLNQFNQSNEIEKQKLVYALLTIHQIKQYWQTLKPLQSEIPIPRFVEQLTLEIGRFYAKQTKNTPLHLPNLFQALAQCN